MNRRKFLHLTGSAALATRLNPAFAGTPAHVVIIGAGIMGASLAYHLARRGTRVTILEKDHPGAGTTPNSFAWLNAAGKTPRPYYELNMLGMEGWRRLSLEIGPELRIQFGGSVHWIPQSTLAENLAKFQASLRDQQTLGYSIRAIDAPEVRTLIPTLTPGPISAATFADHEATIDPAATLQLLLRRAQSFGAVIQYPCEVTGFDISSNRVQRLHTTRGPIEADHVVLAAGNGIPPLASHLGLPVPLVESPGVLAHTTPMPPLLHRVAVAEDATLKQNPDGRIVTGTDFGGTPNIQPTRAEGEKLLATAAKYLPALKHAKLDFVTLGHRVMPQDGHSIIGHSRTCTNAYVIATHSGMTLAPIFGQLASMEILEGVDVDLLRPFRPYRFA